MIGKPSKIIMNNEIIRNKGANSIISIEAIILLIIKFILFQIEIKIYNKN